MRALRDFAEAPMCSWRGASWTMDAFLGICRTSLAPMKRTIRDLLHRTRIAFAAGPDELL